MKIISDNIRIPLWLVFLMVLTILISICLFWIYDLDATDIKQLSLIGGVAGGLIVYAATFITMLGPLKKADRHDQLGVIDLLSNRHDKEYYKNLVGGCKQRVDVMGASCTRFVEDFLDMDSEDKVLVDALDKHCDLKIRLLIPTAAKMSRGSRGRANALTRKFKALTEAYGDRIQLRRFDQEAHHSFVLADDDLVAGPIFEKDKSKYAPAVHVAAWTRFGAHYTKFFQNTWDQCGDDARG